MSTTSDEITTREEMETEHWRLACLVLKHHNDELRMKCSQLKKRYEEKKGVEISRKRDEEPNVIVYKRKKYTDTLENQQQCVKLNKELEAYKVKCQALSAELERKGTESENLRVVNSGLYDEIEEYRSKYIGTEDQRDKRRKYTNEIFEIEQRDDDKCVEFKLGKELRDDAVEIERLKMELEIQVTISLNHEIRCQGLCAELERKEMELKNLMVVTNGFAQERQGYRTRCIRMEEQIKGLTEEGIVMAERICQLEELNKKMETTNESDQRFTGLETMLLNLQEENATLRFQVSGGETSRDTEFRKKLEAYKIKCESFSSELEQKRMELENLQVVNGGLEHERKDFRTKCIGLEDKIKGLVEDVNAMSHREKSAGERICQLEEIVKKLQEENETLRSLQNGVSGEITSWDFDGMFDVADEAQLIRTETSPNSSFTPASCKRSCLQLNSNGVLSSGDAPPDHYQRDYYFARAVLGGFETDGTLTRLGKCSGTPSSTENQVLLKQDGARPSSTSCFF